jgi:hypothetical protein
MVSTGTMIQGEHPRWAPLIELVGERLAGDFMWMYEVELHGGAGPLQAYKHRWTRRYLLLTDAGDAMSYTADGRYRAVGIAQALRAAYGRA